eukprot:3229239-Rhodomonas_salina.2
MSQLPLNTNFNWEMAIKIGVPLPSSSTMLTSIAYRYLPTVSATRALGNSFTDAVSYTHLRAHETEADL